MPRRPKYHSVQGGNIFRSVLGNRQVRNIASNVVGRAAGQAVGSAVGRMTGNDELGRQIGSASGQITKSLANEGLSRVAGAGFTDMAGNALRSVARNKRVRNAVTNYAAREVGNRVSKYTGNQDIGAATGQITRALANEGMDRITGSGTGRGRHRRYHGSGIDDDHDTSEYKLGGKLQSNGMQPWVNQHEKMAYVRSFRGGSFRTL